MDNISKENIISAINEIKANPESRKGRASSTYDILYEGIEYPPKLVISIANRYATGIELGPNDFRGGIGTQSFKLLKEYGFEIKQKDWLISPIIEKFINQSKTTNLKTKDYPKKFKGLSLKVSFGQGVPAKIPWIGLTKQPHTISNGIYPVFLYYKEIDILILAYGVSETNKSTFQWLETNNLITIKDWYVKKFRKTPERYGDSYIKGIYELNQGIDSDIIEDDLNEIIKVYAKMDDSNIGNQNYWVFQGSPKIYNMGAALEANALKTWTVSSHRDKIKNGDKFILWLTGKYSGCYALGTVVSDVTFMQEEDEEMSFYVKPTEKVENFRVNITIDHNFFNKPILSDLVKNNPVFKDFKGGNQGTNFISTKEEYDSILKILDLNEKKKNMKITKELNQILFGPPGTGKTYKLQKEYFNKFTINETSLNRDQHLESIISNLSWWQTISIAVLDLGVAKVNEIYNHEFIRIKEKNSFSKTVRPTIWSQLQSHTILECPNVNVSTRLEPLIFNKSEDSKWSVDIELLKQFYPEAIEILEKSKNFIPDINKSIKNYEFVTFHQSFSYEDFVEGIKPKLDDTEKDVSFEIKDGVFKRLCLKAESDPNNDYAIFIDEINRGNVSAIFGELITLIEKDKRIGGRNEIRLKLPYSKSEFGVPSNLYIIGTMNTSDRSVEAIDTALRRRFSFTEIMPNSELLKSKQFNGFNLADVLDTINSRIEALLDRDHTIGHSYLLQLESGDLDGLTSVFTNNILPLLQEYFYNDYEKIALVLGEGFIRLNNNKVVKFADFKNIDLPEISNQFEIINPISNIEDAILKLLNK